MIKIKIMKRKIIWATLLTVASIIGISCSKEDVVDPAVTDKVEDGYYISGDATPYAKLSVKGLFTTGLNEAQSNVAIDSLQTMYVALKGGKDFTITHVAGKDVKIFGQGSDAATTNPNGAMDQIKGNVMHGTLSESGKFQVPTDGLYQVTVYTKTNSYTIGQVTSWGAIGGSMPGGWSSDVALNMVKFRQDTLVFRAENVLVLDGDFKFRYSGGWKLNVSDPSSASSYVKINTNYGGTVDALVPGGSNISWPKTKVGYYTIEMIWIAGHPEMKAKLTKTKDYIPPAYPTNTVYLVGSGVGSDWGWGTTGDELPLIGLAGGASNEGIYWRIAYVTADQPFKISEANWGAWNLGLAAESTVSTGEFDLVKGGGSQNIKLSQSGYYMFVLNCKDNKIRLSIQPVQIYGMGGAFGGWTSDVPANLFTVDNVNKKITGQTSAAGDLRMYAKHAWIPDWWNAEFIIDKGKIVYRGTGGDPAAIPVTAGQSISLDFTNDTGSIQ